MPSGGFNFVSRVTAINANYGVHEPCSIEMEFDIPLDFEFLLNNSPIMCPLIESSHIGIFLLGYIGIDELFNGEASYRVVDSSMRVLL